MKESSDGHKAPLAGVTPPGDTDPQETAEWLQSLDYVAMPKGRQRAQFLLERLREQAFRRGVPLVSSATTPYINTIPADQEPPYPGDRELERRSRASSAGTPWRWSCGPTSESPGIGGHISTFASAATLYEVAFNHFFHGKQGDAAARPGLFPRPRHAGIYARAFLLGRLTRAAPAELPPRTGSPAAGCRPIRIRG